MSAPIKTFKFFLYLNHSVNSLEAQRNVILYIKDTFNSLQFTGATEVPSINYLDAYDDIKRLFTNAQQAWSNKVAIAYMLLTDKDWARIEKVFGLEPQNRTEESSLLNIA